MNKNSNVYVVMMMIYSPLCRGPTAKPPKDPGTTRLDPPPPLAKVTASNVTVFSFAFTEV